MTQDDDVSIAFNREKTSAQLEDQDNFTSLDSEAFVGAVISAKHQTKQQQYVQSYIEFQICLDVLHFGKSATV